MTQTIYAHVSKRIKKNKKNKIITSYIKNKNKIDVIYSGRFKREINEGFSNF
jgi:hypothetical protein